MKKNFLRIFLAIYIALVMALNTGAMLYAEGDAGSGDYDFWEAGATWWKQQEGDIIGIDDGVLSQLARIVEIVGTGVIAIATVTLGIKYLLGTPQAKSDVKESLITLLVACIFFFGWTSIRDAMITGINFGDSGAATGVGSGSQFFLFGDSGDLQTAMSTIFTIVAFIGRCVAIGVTVFMGVKFIYSGAEEKAKVKQKGVMYIIGIILILLTSQMLTFISNAITETF